ncbi:MAG: class II aldolase/adducin family protein [Oscillospiraceae bacterium]
MENHGALTVGVDIIQAYYRMETLEHFARWPCGASARRREDLRWIRYRSAAR